MIQRNEKKLHLVRKDELLDECIGTYETELKPKLKKDNLTFTDEELNQKWKDLKLNGQAVWGGEAAADFLTGMLKPKELTAIYSFRKGRAYEAI